MDEKTFEMRKSLYVRTTSGKGWKSKPEEVVNETVSLEKWQRIVNPQWRRLQTVWGGYERATNGYTKYGFLPVTLVNISPDRELKVVYEILND